jgi:hypothetical protein
VHDLLDDLLTQAQTADATTAQQQHRPHAAGSAGQPAQLNGSSGNQRKHGHQQDLQQQQHVIPPEEQMQEDEPRQLEQQVPASKPSVVGP